MSDLNTFIKNQRDFIENILDVLFISTHYYLLHNDYHLIKDDMVKKIFFKLKFHTGFNRSLN
jgi:hypothetical protein